MTCSKALPWKRACKNQGVERRQRGWSVWCLPHALPWCQAGRVIFFSFGVSVLSGLLVPKSVGWLATVSLPFHPSSPVPQLLVLSGFPLTHQAIAIIFQLWQQFYPIHGCSSAPSVWHREVLTKHLLNGWMKCPVQSLSHLLQSYFACYCQDFYPKTGIPYVPEQQRNPLVIRFCCPKDQHP